jgi:hypothetical protein
MIVKDLIDLLKCYKANNEVVIPLKQPGVGGTPCTKILGVSHGIDWDNGKVFIHTETPVVTQEHLDRIQKYNREFEHLLYMFAMENNLEYAGQPLMGSKMCPKGSAVRAFKEAMKKHVNEYLNPKGH